jgi:hypothetical protein
VDVTNPDTEVTSQLPEPCPWHEDNGYCEPDTCVSVEGVTTGENFFAHRPLVEVKLALPDGAPDLPTGMHLGYLSLPDIDTGDVVEGKVLVPFAGVGYGPPDPGNAFAPLEMETAWGVYEAEMQCVCSEGRFADDYKANGVKMHCP